VIVITAAAVLTLIAIGVLGPPIWKSAWTACQVYLKRTDTQIDMLRAQSGLPPISNEYNTADAVVAGSSALITLALVGAGLYLISKFSRRRAS